MSITLGGLPLGTDERSVNPFLPSNEFIPDGEPRVFGDRVYLYGSHDVASSPTRMCAGDYVCYSAALDDLAAWRYHGVIYRRAIRQPLPAQQRVHPRRRAPRVRRPRLPVRVARRRELADAHVRG